MSQNERGFDLDAEGNVKVCPLTGWTVAPVADMACILRLEFARSPDQLGKPAESLQLIVTVDQARQFAQAVQRMLDRIDPSAPPGTLRN